MRRLTLLLVALLAAAGPLHATVDLQALGGWSAPLSPLGPDSFATAHRLGLEGWGRLLWLKGDWTLGVEGGGASLQRQDQTGSLDAWQGGLSAGWGFSVDEVAKDRVLLTLGAGWGGATAGAPGLGRSWTAPAGSLGLTYELPLHSHLDLLVGGALWGLLGPDGFDPILRGSLGVGLGFYGSLFPPAKVSTHD